MSTFRTRNESDRGHDRGLASLSRRWPTRGRPGFETRFGVRLSVTRDCALPAIRPSSSPAPALRVAKPFLCTADPLGQWGLLDSIGPPRNAGHGTGVKGNDRLREALPPPSPSSLLLFHFASPSPPSSRFGARRATPAAAALPPPGFFRQLSFRVG